MPQDTGANAHRAVGADPGLADSENDWLAGALDWSAARIAELLVPPPEPPGATLRWGADASEDPIAYRRWCELGRGAGNGSDRSELPSTGPVMSVVVPLYQPDLGFLERCIESVRAQSYEDWELCLCDDGSNDPDLASFLRRAARPRGRVGTDPRLRVVINPVNCGISTATNSAIALSSGQYVAFLDQDDTLDVDALAEVAAALKMAPLADVLYSDEDKIDDQDLAFGPHFKPDWAPDLLLTFPYLGHLLVVKRDLLHAVGGLRSEFDGSQDYDLMLRATELARSIVHIPKVLYHWRATAGSSAAEPQAKPWAHAASRRALEETVSRRKLDATVHDAPFAPGWYHVRREISGQPKVAIIIPFRDQAAMTARCVASLGDAPGYQNFEIVLVDNGSTEPETMALRRRLTGQGIRILDYRDRFNWSAINNLAAASCDAEFLLFMNNDVEATTQGWLRALVELAQVPEVGVVGARLVFPNGALQHAGIVLGMGGIAGHVLAGLPAGEHGYFAWDAIVRPYSAVTGACMMTRREVFEELGGFDEELDVAFGDVDYCMQATDAGLRVLFTPHCELIHYESVSRGMSGWTLDVGPFIEKWGLERFWADPLFSPNLDLFASWCPLRTPNERTVWETVVERYRGD
jgi:GT2 family glycosyltransferase